MASDEGQSSRFGFGHRTPIIWCDLLKCKVVSREAISTDNGFTAYDSTASPFGAVGRA